MYAKQAEKVNDARGARKARAESTNIHAAHVHGTRNINNIIDKPTNDDIAIGTNVPSIPKLWQSHVQAQRTTRWFSERKTSTQRPARRKHRVNSLTPPRIKSIKSFLSFLPSELASTKCTMTCLGLGLNVKCKKLIFNRNKLENILYNRPELRYTCVYDRAVCLSFIHVYAVSVHHRKGFHPPSTCENVQHHQHHRKHEWDQTTAIMIPIMRVYGSSACNFIAFPVSFLLFLIEFLFPFYFFVARRGLLEFKESCIWKRLKIAKCTRIFQVGYKFRASAKWALNLPRCNSAGTYIA